MLDLSSLLSYTNPQVLLRYERDFPHNRLSAAEALSELIKFFWLCERHAQEQRNSPQEHLNFNCMMHTEMRELDDMWHTFLLFTKEYQEFCLTHFGYFIHHSPLDEESRLFINEEYEMNLTRFLSFLYDNLGATTVRTWFDECFNGVKAK